MKAWVVVGCIGHHGPKSLEVYRYNDQGSYYATSRAGEVFLRKADADYVAKNCIGSSPNGWPIRVLSIDIPELAMPSVGVYSMKTAERIIKRTGYCPSVREYKALACEAVGKFEADAIKIIRQLVEG